MDVKQTVWYGRLELYGVLDPIMFEGPLAIILGQLTRKLMDVNIRKGQNGSRDATFVFSDSPLSTKKGESAPDDPLAKYMKEWLDSGDVIQMSDEEIDALRHPMTRDPKFERFQYLGATQSNFESSPEEYYDLWNYFESLWPDETQMRKKRSK